MYIFRKRELDTFYIAGLLGKKCEKNYDNDNLKIKKSRIAIFRAYLFCGLLQLLAK